MLAVYRVPVPPEKLQTQPSKVPLVLMCALLFKGVAVPLRACVKLLCAYCCPEPDLLFA
jgi:hypothetical protein